MINQNSLGNNLTKKIGSVLVILILLFGNLPGFSNLTPKVEAMQIFIKLQIGPNLILDAEPTDRIEDVKAKIQVETGISPDHQKLYFNNKELEDGNTLQDYSIQKDSIIQLFGQKMTVVDSQSDALIYGVAKKVTYNMTTEGINVGSHDGTLDNAPKDVTASALIAAGGTGELTITSTENTLPGTYANITATIDGVTSTPFTLTISQATLSAILTPTNKIYDGHTTATIADIKYSGIVGNDSVEITGGTLAFSDGNAADGKTVYIDQPYSLSGDAALYYKLGTLTVKPANISKANQASLVLTGLEKNYTLGDAPITLGVTGTMINSAVTYTSCNPKVATINGNILTIVGVGSFTVIAEKVGDTNYHAATVTSSTITVKPQSYAVLSHFGTWTGIGTRTARVDAEHTKFVKLMYGDTEIDASNYTITKGSTVITLNESHLKNYAKGTHWFVAVSLFA